MRSDYIDVKPEKIESRTSSRTSSSYRSTDRLDSKSNSKIDKDSRSRSTKSSSSSSSTIRKRKSSDRRSRDRSRSSSKRHRTSKSDISNDKTSKSEKKVKKNNGTTLPELPNIIKVVKNSQKLVEQSSNSSPVAEIQAEEELHTDNESDAEMSNQITNNVSHQKESETVPKPPEITTLKNDLIKVQKVTFGTLAAKAESSGFLPEYKPPPPPAIPDPPPQNRRNSEIPTDEDHTDNPTDNPTSGIDEDEDDDIILTDDSLSELSDSELDKDPTHRMALEYYDKFSKGQLDWCEKFPELGPECRNCHRRENCNFPCDHPPKYQCKLCGQWNHQTFQCRDRAELEYKKNYNIPCVYCSKRNHLGRNCPDHWRQFHRTTGSTYIPYDNTPADRTKASCYNCAAKGHWGHECTAPRPTPLLGPILEPFTTGRVSDSQSDLLKDDKIRREKRNKKRFLITIG